MPENTKYRWHGAAMVAEENAETIKRLCREPDSGVEKDKTVHEASHEFPDKLTAVVQLCSTPNPAAECCWVQCLWLEDGQEVHVSEVTDDFFQPFEYETEEQVYVMQVHSRPEHAIPDHTQMPMLRLNMPWIFKDEAFVAWLNAEETSLATWHKGGKPDEYSDFFITWSSHESSNSDMPGHVFAQISALVLERFHDTAELLVWVANI